MRKFILLYSIISLVVISMSAQRYPKGDNVIRLLTYNSHYCKGATDPGSISAINTQRFASVIKALDADIVSLQELDKDANSRGKRNLLSDIAKASGIDYNIFFGEAASYDGGYIGCGSLVRKSLPVVKSKNIVLPGDEGRMAVRTDLENFSFMATHFDLNDSKRIQGAQKIITELDYIRKPVFLAGDLNDSHRWNNGGIAFPTLMERFAISSDIVGNSIPGRTDNGALIDYILFRDYENSGIKIVESNIVRSLIIDGVVTDMGAISDHYPVYVDIEIPGSGVSGITADEEFKMLYNNHTYKITFESDKPVTKVEVYNINGQKVIDQSAPAIESVSLSAIEKGTYVIKAFSGNKFSIKKILK